MNKLYTDSIRGCGQNSGHQNRRCFPTTERRRRVAIWKNVNITDRSVLKFLAYLKYLGNLRISYTDSDSTLAVGSDTETERDIKSCKSLQSSTRARSVSSSGNYCTEVSPPKPNIPEQSLQNVETEVAPSSSSDEKFYRTPLTSSINSAKSDFSNGSTGSFTRLRTKSYEKRRGSKGSIDYEKKRMGTGVYKFIIIYGFLNLSKQMGTQHLDLFCTSTIFISSTFSVLRSTGFTST